MAVGHGGQVLVPLRGQLRAAIRRRSLSG